MGELFRRTVEREELLRSKNYSILSIWECEFDRLMQTDEALQLVAAGYRDRSRMDPRRGLYGGRTNAFRLYHHCQPNERILYKDVVSEYPFVNKTMTYPVGPYKVILDNFGVINDYFGIAEVTILPPRNLHLPVLPYRTDKLLFPLCRTCAEHQQSTACQHDDTERSLTGVWTTVELAEAVKHGYQITEWFEVIHYPESKPRLFQPYIDKFLGLKVQASGLPSGVVTTEQIDQFVAAFYSKENVQLDVSQLRKNPALRVMAKLCLNAFVSISEW